MNSHTTNDGRQLVSIVFQTNLMREFGFWHLTAGAGVNENEPIKPFRLCRVEFDLESLQGIGLKAKKMIRLAGTNEFRFLLTHEEADLARHGRFIVGKGDKNAILLSVAGEEKTKHAKVQILHHRFPINQPAVVFMRFLRKQLQVEFSVEKTSTELIENVSHRTVVDENSFITFPVGGILTTKILTSFDEVTIFKSNRQWLAKAECRHLNAMTDLTFGGHLSKFLLHETKILDEKQKERELTQAKNCIPCFPAVERVEKKFHPANPFNQTIFSSVDELNLRLRRQET